MAKIGIFYGSTTGKTEAVAQAIGAELGDGAAAARDIAGAEVEDIMENDVLILGTSTWGLGDLQDDWAAFLPKLGEVDLGGKKVALFGTGDQMGFESTFVNGIGILYDQVSRRGATVVGAWGVEGYEFAGSMAVVDGRFAGLVIDEDRQGELTAQRIRTWVEQVKKEIGL